MQQEAFTELYRRRINRNQFYPASVLGAFATDLGAAAWFFETLWSHVSPALTETDKAWILNVIAVNLRAIGRLLEALEPMRVAVEMAVLQQNWEAAAVRASNLSQLELLLGKVPEAVNDAEQCVMHADRSGDLGQRLTKRVAHADALHQANALVEAERRFREAEQLQTELQPITLCFTHCKVSNIATFSSPLTSAPPGNEFWTVMHPDAFRLVRFRT